MYRINIFLFLWIMINPTYKGKRIRISVDERGYTYLSIEYYPKHGGGLAEIFRYDKYNPLSYLIRGFEKYSFKNK